MKYKIHRCNCRKVWSIQNRKTKTIASSLLLDGHWKAELRPERMSNPKGFVTTNNSQAIIFNPSLELVEQYVTVDKLIYDKKNVDFNVDHGDSLYFAEDGSCFILKKIEK
ncbi:hypothetical protein [Neobacillus drentensis]|jgi:hypothetical protein|uniref:hypothetical protein n=1 Tax=Neobacillus drentensis TaxID=220684 RepID=UPI003000EE24